MNKMLLNNMEALVKADIKIKGMQSKLKEWRELRRRLRKEVKMPKWVCERYVTLRKEIGTEWFTAKDAMKIWNTSYASSETFFWYFNKAGLMMYKKKPDNLRKTMMKLKV